MLSRYQRSRRRRARTGKETAAQSPAALLENESLSATDTDKNECNSSSGNAAYLKDAPVNTEPTGVVFEDYVNEGNAWKGKTMN